MHDGARRLAYAVLLAAGLWLAVGSQRAAAAYVLAPGDTIELNVVGAPELQTKAVIDVDGQVRLPLVSSLQAADRTLDDLQAEVRRQISQQAYRQRTPDGRRNVVAFDPGEISLSIVEYRPVYVRGDVSKPGEEPFRPGLTVRKLVALAGGYDIMRFRMDNPVLQSSDLRAEYEQLWTEFARQQAHAALVQAEVDGKPAPDLARAVQAPIPVPVLSDVIGTEAAQVDAQNTDYRRQLSYLQQASANAATEVKSFIKPRSDAEHSEQDENDYMQRLGQLAAKGVIARPQIIDQQRSLLSSSERFLNYSSRISELNHSKADYDRQAEHLTDEHRALLLKDLQDCTVQIAAIRAKLQAVSEKLLYTGAISAQLVRGTGSKPSITVVHAGSNGREIEAGEDTPLEAGDVVDVSLRAEMLPEAATH